MDSTKLIALSEPRSPAAEAYRALRANLAFASLDKPLEAFVITSPGVDEPRSLVAANLAVVMAQAGQRVLLVDADLRRPSLHTIFDVPQEPGLTSFILNQDELAANSAIETAVPGLRLLPSGALPPNPADIMGSQRMQVLLEELKAQADIVLLVTPPVTVAVDAPLLAAQTDGLVLVVRAGHSRLDRVEQAKELLERFRVRLFGAVLTDAAASDLWTGY